jgi:hypothetical protein
MSHGSASSIVELSRSRSRYYDQDALLRAFVSMPGCTAKEVAVEALNWMYEQYANAPKRAFDLQALGYLEQLPGRQCRHTSKVAHAYRVTEKGLAHLREIGVALPASVVEPVVVESAEARPDFSKLRGLLG